MAPLRNGIAVHGQMSTARDGVKELFVRLQAQSVLLVPIMVDARYWGHIGLDICGRERVWSSAEVHVLRLLADLIGTAITRERYLAELHAKHRPSASTRRAVISQGPGFGSQCGNAGESMRSACGSAMPSPSATKTRRGA